MKNIFKNFFSLSSKIRRFYKKQECIICFLGLQGGAPLLGLAKSIYFIRFEFFRDTIQYILNWPLPIGALDQRATETQRNDGTEQQPLLRIPTGRRQTSRLFASAAGNLNQGLQGSNSTSGQTDESWTRDLPFAKQSTRTTGPHCLQRNSLLWIHFQYSVHHSRLTDLKTIALR